MTRNLLEIESWPYIDASFNDYFINIFTKSSKIVSDFGQMNLNGNFDYDDQLSNAIFSTETELKYKSYKYLNVIKCGYYFKNKTVDQIQEESKKKIEEVFFNAVLALDIPEFKNKEKEIKKQLFKQKLRIQYVLMDRSKMNFEERKFVLLDLALDKSNGVAKNTIQNNTKQTNAHSIAFLKDIIDQSLIDQYQEWTGMITPKKFIIINDYDESTALKNIYLNNTVQFGLIYIQKIMLSEFITLLNLWINENKFGNDLTLSKYYLGFIRKCDFDNLSTKNLYNEYSYKLDKIFNIEIDKQKVLERIKEIENLLDKEKLQVTNMLLFLMALLQLVSVFIADIKNTISYLFYLKEDVVNKTITVVCLGFCVLIFLIFNKKRRF